MKIKRLAAIVLLLMSIFLYSATAAKDRTPEPLNYENAVKFFRETLKERPLKVHQRCAVFFDGASRVQQKKRGQTATLRNASAIRPVDSKEFVGAVVRIAEQSRQIR
jgi:hypothetical protein